MLKQTHEQYEAIVTYLHRLYLSLSFGEADGSLSEKERFGYFQLIGSSCVLLHLLLSSIIQARIPADLINKCLSKGLINYLVKNFAVLPSEIQVIVFWSLICN
jgi:hypothetical protein